MPIKGKVYGCIREDKVLQCLKMLNYIIRKAKSIENSPTIILIHGYGSNAEDLFSFKPYLPENYNIIAIQAPITLSYNSYAWYPLYPKMMELLILNLKTHGLQLIY